MRHSILFLMPILCLAADGEEIQKLMDNGHWKRARPLAEAAYKSQPNDAHVVYTLAEVRRAFARIDDSAKLAEMAVRLDPKSGTYHRVLGEVLADQAEKVSFIRQIGFARRIRSEFDTALALAPKDPEILFDHMQYFMEAPGIAGGDKKKAPDVANEILKVDPARGYLALAFIAQREKQNDKLEGLYQKAVEANPKNVQAQISLVNLYLSSKPPNTAAAEPHARAVLDQYPDRMDGYRWLVYVLMLEKRYDDAAKLIARAETAIPDDLAPYVAAARALLRDGADLPKAEIYLQKYIAQTKEPEAGGPLLEGVHWSLGLVYEKEGRKAEARSELETSLRLNPNFEPAKRDIKRFK